ncbi:NAD-dependent epimerase/dehydratase family protein [Acidimicrobiia bacterium]|nr:NAD-dependent epimerase/dehydratase family protein [Acidimicrobiia bacterium]
MKKILLTGGFGYIGSYFVKKYHHSYDLHILDTNYFEHSINTDLKQNRFLVKDIRDISKNDLNDIEIIVHMGELSNDPLGDLNKNITNEINHIATKNLLILADKTSVKKFIYMSSASVYGFSEEVMNEKSPLNPLTEYSKAKSRNESFIKSSDFSFETVIMRNATAFGFSENLRLDLVVNDLTYGALINNEIKLLSDGTPKRPIVHIHDICQIINLIIRDKRNLDKEIFNIGSNEMNFSIREIAEQVGQCLSLPKITYGKKDLDQRSYSLNFQKLNDYFPTYKVEYNLEAGILDLLENLKNYKLKGSEKRVEQLKQLIDGNKINNKLYWVIK